MRISDSVWKISAEGNVYFINLKTPTVIDTSHHSYRELIKKSLSEITDLNKIKRVIFTHLHTDHIGNFDLFPNAEFYASKQAIEDLKKDPVGTILDPYEVKKFKIKLKPAEDIKDLEIIPSPGHTKGAICIWFKEEKVLFTGDTIFKNGFGRTDLPTSQPNKMQESITKLQNYEFKVLAPGHDY